MPEELTESQLAEWEGELPDTPTSALNVKWGIRLCRLIAEVRRLRTENERLVRASWCGCPNCDRLLQTHMETFRERDEVRRLKAENERLRDACEEVLAQATCYFPAAMLDQVEAALGRCPAEIRLTPPPVPEREITGRITREETRCPRN